MSKNADYTITTLSSNLSQRNQPVFSQGGNNSVSLRNKCAPYTVVSTEDDENSETIPKFPLGRSDSC